LGPAPLSTYTTPFRSIDRCLVRGEETHVRAVTDAGRPAIDGRVQPELRVFTAPGLRAGAGEDARTTQRGQHCVVKGHGLVEAVRSEEHTSELQSRENL